MSTIRSKPVQFYKPTALFWTGLLAGGEHNMRLMWTQWDLRYIWVVTIATRCLLVSLYLYVGYCRLQYKARIYTLGYALQINLAILLTFLYRGCKSLLLIVLRSNVFIYCYFCIVLWHAGQVHPSIHQWPSERPLKYLRAFKHPTISTACFIFKAYPVTKDTSIRLLDYMGTGVSSWMEDTVSLGCLWTSLYAIPTHTLIGWGADQSPLSLCCLDTLTVVAKHQSTTFTSWTIFLKVRIWKIVLPQRSAEAGPCSTCCNSVQHQHHLYSHTISGECPLHLMGG